MLHLIRLLLVMNLGGCGTNIYQQFDNEDPAEAASAALDEEKSDKAINILEAAIKEDPLNYELVSLLASAKAQKGGVDTMDFALNMASSGGTGDIVGLFTVVPEATTSNISLLQEAVNLLESIPEADLYEADRFKLSMFYTSLLTLRTKLFDSNGDGSLSAEELLELDDASAVQILQDLVSAQSTISNYSSDDGTQDAASNVNTIATAINDQEGATDAEKLRNFLDNN